MYLRAYNKAADSMNQGRISEFNSQQRKKYGDDFAKRDGYVDDYLKMFNKEVNKNLNRSLNDFYNGSKNYQKAEQLVQKYDMIKWDDLARKNAAIIKELRTNMG